MVEEYVVGADGRRLVIGLGVEGADEREGCVMGD
jgi:hypothetical protein